MVRAALVHRLIALSLVAVGCAAEPRIEPTEKAAAVPAARPKVIRPALMPNVQLSCTGIFGSVALSSSLGLEVAVVPSTERVPGANAVCSIQAAALPTKAEERARERAHLVRAGDELCEVRVFCSELYDPDTEAKRCTAADQAFSKDIGQATCIRSFRRDRHTVTFLDDDARCRVEVYQGLRVTGVERARSCATAARELLTADKLSDGAPALAAR